MKWLISIILLIGITTFCYAEQEPDWDKLVLAIITCESGGNPNAYNSRSRAIGLMQITPIVFQEFNSSVGYYSPGRAYKMRYEKDGSNTAILIGNNINVLYDSQANRVIGTWYLHRLKDHYLKDKYTIERLLACYNGGITKLRSVNYDINKMSPETKRYVKKVLDLYKRR